MNIKDSAKCGDIKFEDSVIMELYISDALHQFTITAYDAKRACEKGIVGSVKSDKDGFVEEISIITSKAV